MSRATCGWSIAKTPTWPRSPSAGRCWIATSRRSAAFVEGAREFCTRRGMSYLLANTEIPVEQLVTNYLRQRGLVR